MESPLRVTGKSGVGKREREEERDEEGRQNKEEKKSGIFYISATHNIGVELLWRGAVETPCTGVAPRFSGNLQAP